MASHLVSSGSKVNIALVREACRRELLRCINQCPGSKAIVWDENLTGPVGLIADYSLLKEYGVGKMFSLTRGKLPHFEEQNCIFLVRPGLENMGIIAENILKEASRAGSKEYHIFFVPRKSLLCEEVLQELGVLGTFSKTGDYALQLIPFDHDIVSLEHELCFKECYLENDQTSLYHVANSLMTLQALYGTIPKIYGKGEMAKQVADMMLRKRRENVDVENQTTPLIDSLILIDRNVDLVTPLLTQLTYEGLIDELFGIANTNVQIPAEAFPAAESETPKSQKDDNKPKKVTLNSAEALFAEIRDMNFSAIGAVLNQKAKNITAEYEGVFKLNRAAKTGREIKEFVPKLPHMKAAKQSLSLHTTIAELVKEVTDSDTFREALHVEQEFFNGIDSDKPHPYIEKSIACKEPLRKILRLVCLQCLVNNGFKPKVLDYYRREILHAYGFEHIVTLTNLEEVGLLRLSTTKTYPTLRKSLKLVVDDVQEQSPNDIAYVHSGYAPLTVRLVQFFSRQSSWRGLEEVLKILPGPTVEETQYLPPSLLKKATSPTAHSADGRPSKTTLVYFLGGCTYTEIAALRFLARQENAPSDFIIATTKLINGNSLINSLMENIVKVPIVNS